MCVTPAGSGGEPCGDWRKNASGEEAAVAEAPRGVSSGCVRNSKTAVGTPRAEQLGPRARGGARPRLTLTTSRRLDSEGEEARADMGR